MEEPKILVDTEQLLLDIQEKEGTDGHSKTSIRTDDRVIARITDGIYRQPGSAIRELLANAYDADATEVIIETDAPRFNTIRVRDNGQGLAKETLAHILHHIGGSSKRTKRGAALNVTSSSDANLSPGGRRLIGKIGVGLFSISQLTPHFQIISKVRGEKFRRVADVLLTTYTEDDLAKRDGGDKTFEAGTVTVWSVPADDLDAHGTDIVLMDLKMQAKELLRSKDRWDSLEHPIDVKVATQTSRPPVFHIGEVDPVLGDRITRTANLPWSETDAVDKRFRILVREVMAQTSDRTTPDLADTLDNYLQMLWSLGLAMPLEYSGAHPLDQARPEDVRVFRLSNQKRGQAVEESLAVGENIAEKLGLEVSKRSLTPFRVIVDGVEIFRPIDLSGLPETSHALKDRLLFVGQCSPDLSRIPDKFRGGSLSFEAYFYWAPKIAPKDHNGVLIRINGASGTLFDETFMKYQVSEQTRLRQIIAEVYVIQGLDAALNIDRESFNYAHPHYLFIQRWVHEALRQLTNQHKKLATNIRQTKLEKKGEASISEIHTVVLEEWQEATDELEEPPTVVFSSGSETPRATSSELVVDRNVVFAAIEAKKRKTVKSVLQKKSLEEKISGIAQILVAYGLLDGMSRERQSALLRAIARIVDSGDIE